MATSATEQLRARPVQARAGRGHLKGIGSVEAGADPDEQERQASERARTSGLDLAEAYRQQATALRAAEVLAGGRRVTLAEGLRQVEGRADG